MVGMVFFSGVGGSLSKLEIGFDRGEGLAIRFVGSEEPLGGTVTGLVWERGAILAGELRRELDSCLDEDGLVEVLLEEALPPLPCRSWFDPGRPELEGGRNS